MWKLPGENWLFKSLPAAPTLASCHTQSLTAPKGLDQNCTDLHSLCLNIINKKRFKCYENQACFFLKFYFQPKRQPLGKIQSLMKFCSLILFTAFKSFNKVVVITNICPHRDFSALKITRVLPGWLLSWYFI